MTFRKTCDQPDPAYLKAYLEYALMDARALDPEVALLLETAVYRLSLMRESETPPPQIEDRQKLN